jgi:5'-3' exonuclease
MGDNTYILIDGSYFNFHRFYSIVRWWKNAHPEEALEDPFNNTLFLEKFKKTFLDTVQGIPKKLGLDKNCKPIILVGKDCKREDIWRNSLYSQYKGTRVQNEEFKGKPFFKMVYEEDLYLKAGATKILSYPTLEADDCIAIYTKHLLKQEGNENISIYIITSDKDYIQLLEPRVYIYNLSFKNILDQKSSIGDSQTELFCKIVMGDTSDNIPSVLTKCGPKTALKCYQDRAYFDERLKKENAYDNLERNKRLVDFNYIPENLVTGFLETIV